jgi:glycosyltransferase involved in cell wall biosynthesis
MATRTDRSDPVADLFVSFHRPTRTSGRGLRAYGVVRALAELGPVELIHTPFGADAPDPAYPSTPGVTLHEITPSRGGARALVYARARAAGVPAAFARTIPAEVLGAVRDRLADGGVGRVIADGPGEAAALRALGDRVVYNAHNLEWRLRGEVGGAGGRRALQRFERGVLDRSAEAWMASRADLEGARALAPDARLRYVPNVVDVASIAPVPPPPPGSPPRVLFLGSWFYPPNVEAGRLLVERVLPLLRADVPEARLVLGGRGAGDALRLDPGTARSAGVDLPGFVDDVRDLYAQTTCVVVPLLTGSGSPLKFVEALAHGVPVVTTPKGAAGIDGTPDRDYLVATTGPDGDVAAGLARTLGDVLRNGADEVGARGRALAEAEYSVAALARRIADQP